MMIDSIEVDDDFQRTDPYWTGFIANTEYSSNGALLIELAALQAGEPITLDSGNYWVKKSVVDQLLAHAKLGLSQFEVVLPDGTNHLVMWDYQGPPVNAQPLFRETYPTDASYMVNVQLKFIKV